MAENSHVRRCIKTAPVSWLCHTVFTRNGRKNLTRVTGTEIILFKDNPTGWSIGKGTRYTWNTAMCACTGVRKIPFRTGNLGLYPPNHTMSPSCSNPANWEIRRKYLKQSTGYTHAQPVHIKVAPLLQVQTCPIHVTTTWSLSIFQLVLWVRLACTTFQLEKNLCFHLVKKYHSCEIYFCGRKKKKKKESPLESFHYKMWGRAPWASTSLLINQCKDCGNPGRSHHSAWLTPGGFDLEMEKIWILFVPPPVWWTQNNQAFFKVYLKILHTNHVHTHNIVSTSKPHRLVFRIVLCGWIV